MEQRKYMYHLPKSGEYDKQDCETTANSVVIIGANGSGKSKLGAWIEEQNRSEVHRIGAQRSLTWGENLIPKSYEQLKNEILYGNEGASVQNRWGWKDGKTTTERRDINATFSAIFAERTAQLEDFDERSKEAVNQTLPQPPREENIVDKIQKIWRTVFPHRDIKFGKTKIIAVIADTEYNGTEMSDGERVALYLIAQALLAPKIEKTNDANAPTHMTIIVDEPEIHLHRSIMNRLWEEIEKERNDCLFIYITHDTQFAANHKHSDKIWAKSYNGNVWEWEKVEQTDFPEQLLLDVLGNRKPIIFVEGTSDSYDAKLYEAVYRDYYVVPCGSCAEVISRTKTFNRLQQEQPQLHYGENYDKAYGVIDRDYRSDNKIAALEKDKIYALKVAEVENLFLAEELLGVINARLGFSDNTRIDEVKNYIINDRFCKQVNKQICEATVTEIKHRLSIIEISNKENEIETSLTNGLKAIDFNAIREETATRYNEVATNKDYKVILSLFNCKDISKSVGSYFGLDNKAYCETVLRLINSDKANDIIKALQNYLPNDELLPIRLNN